MQQRELGVSRRGSRRRHRYPVRQAVKAASSRARDSASRGMADGAAYRENSAPIVVVRGDWREAKASIEVICECATAVRRCRQAAGRRWYSALCGSRE